VDGPDNGADASGGTSGVPGTLLSLSTAALLHIRFQHPGMERRRVFELHSPRSCLWPGRHLAEDLVLCAGRVNVPFAMLRDGTFYAPRPPRLA
jgi:hypothetical protein